MSDPLSFLGASTTTDDELDTIAAKNRNPGNLRDSTGAFRQFKSHQEGFDALVNDIQSKQTGDTGTDLTGDSSLEDFFNVYAPKSDNNDPKSYAKFVASKLGVDAGSTIGSLDSTEIAKAIAQREDSKYYDSIKDTLKQQDPLSFLRQPKPTEQDPLSFLRQPSIEDQKTQAVNEYIRKPITIQGVDVSPAPGSAAAALANMMHDMYSKVGEIFNHPGVLLAGVKRFGHNIFDMVEQSDVIQAPSIGGKVLGVIKAPFSIGKSILWDGLAKPIVGNAAELLADELSDNKAFTPEEREQKWKELLPTAAMFALGFSGASKAISAGAKIEDVVGMTEKSLLEQATKPDMSAIRIAAKAAIHTAPAGAALGFVSGGPSAEESVADAFQTGIAGALIASVAGVGKAVVSKLKGVDLNVAKNAAIDEYARRQSAAIMQKYPDGRSALDFAKDAFSSDDVNKIILRESAGQTIVVRNVADVKDLKADNPNIVYHTRPDGETIGISSGTEFTPANRAYIEKYGFFPNQVVDYNGKQYAIASTDFGYKGEPLRGGKLEATVKLYDPVGNKLMRKAVPLSELSYSSEPTPASPEGATPKSLTSTIITDFAHLMDADELKTTIELQNKAFDLKQAQSLEIGAKAGTRGVILKDLAGGRMQLSDYKTDRVLGTFNTPEEIHTFLDNYGGVSGKDIITSSPSISTEGVDIGSLPRGTKSLEQPTTRQVTLAKLRASWFKNVIEPKTYLDAYQTLFPEIPFVKENIDFQEAIRKMNAALQPQKGRVIDIHKAGKGLSPQQLEDVQTYLETASPEERMSSDPNVRHIKSRDITVQERELIDRVSKVSGGIDGFESSVHTWGNVRDEIRSLTDSGQPADFEALLQEHAKATRLAPDQVDLVRTLQNITESGLNKSQLHVGAVLGVARSILANEPSKSAFALSHNFTLQQYKIASMLKDYYDNLANVFQIPEESRLNHFVPHIIEDAGTMDHTAMWKFLNATSLEDPDFRHELTRLSIGLNYDKDPIATADRYTFSGMRKQYLTEQSNNFNSFVNKATQQIFESLVAKGSKNKVATSMAQNFKKTMVTYIGRAQFFKEEDALAAQGALEAAAYHLGIDPSDDKFQKFVSRMSDINAFATMGFAPYQFARDVVSWMQSNTMHFGTSATARAIKLGAASSAMEGELEKMGLVPAEVNRLQLINPTVDETPGWKSKGGEVWNKLAETASWMNGRRQAYQFMYRSTYLERVNTFSKAYAQFLQDKNRTKFENTIGLKAYTPPEISTFNKILDGGASNAASEAAKFLGTMSGYKVVGVFGQANNPIGFNSKWGRVFGAFGKYPFWAFNMLADQAAGPNAKLAALRWGSMTTAMAGASMLSGVNLERWSLSPSHMLFAGGPQWQFLSTVYGAMQGNDPQAQKFYQGKLLQYMSVRNPFIPIPWAFYNILEGSGIAGGLTNSEDQADMLKENPTLAIARMAGFSVSPWTVFNIPIGVFNKVSSLVGGEGDVEVPDITKKAQGRD